MKVAYSRPCIYLIAVFTVSIILNYADWNRPEALGQCDIRQSQAYSRIVLTTVASLTAHVAISSRSPSRNRVAVDADKVRKTRYPERLCEHI